MSDSEMREDAKYMYERGTGWPEHDVSKHATEFLAAITQRTSLEPSVAALVRDCQEWDRRQ